MAQIVVIDDMDEMRMLYEDLLTSYGHEVLAFDDGASALSAVDFAVVDLVITDLQMPTSGQLVIRTIRACGYEVPILVVSGHVMASDFDELFQLGAQSVMSKPPDFKVFRQTVTELLVSRKVSCAEGEVC
ncbi:MAG: CheY-like chemotaxis protein [Candidatus Latescibacterota bacterium]|jgi:CheY-like chemotaxis protein